MTKKKLAQQEKERALMAAMVALKEFLERCHVCVVRHDQTKIVDHGTGLLMRVENHYLVVTAAHVIRDCELAELQLVYAQAMSNDRISFVRREFFGGTETDKLDIGILEVAPESLPILDEKEFITIDYFFDPPGEITGELVVAHGYPGAWLEQPLPRKYSVQSLTRNVFPIDPIMWSKDTIAETELEFECTRQIAEVEKTDATQLPSAAGLSGGTIWVARFQEYPIWSPRLGKILGLIVNRDDDREILRVCRSDHVFWTIKFFFGDP